MNGQIVLCKGVNDGEELERSIRELGKYAPCMESVSVVPAGLTRFREGLYPLEPFTKEEAAETIDCIERWQKVFFERHGIHFIHASDEFYLLAEREMPEEARYDGYLQLENGVGMLRALTEEVRAELSGRADDGARGEVSIATGMLAYPYIKQFAEETQAVFPGRRAHVYAIRNEFFGDPITVAGLITGRDLAKQLSGKPLGERLLLPCAMFRSGEEVFLDDMTREELQNALQVRVDIVKSSGHDFVEAILRPVENAPEHGAYELEDIAEDDNE